MEEICVSFESIDSAASQRESGPRSSQRRFDGAVVLSLGLLSVGLLAGLIGLGVHYQDSMRRSAADFSIIINNLSQHLQASHDQLSTVHEERDLLNARLAQTRKELHSLSTQNQDSMRRSAADFSNIINNLTQHLQASHYQLSTVLEERDLLNANLTETRKELHSLSTQNQDSMRRSAADFSNIINNLTQHLQASHDQLSTVLEERDLLNVNLTETRKELHSLSTQNHDSMRRSAADFSNIINNLTQHLQASHDQLSTVLEERDLLNANLTETRKELHSLSTQNQDSMRRSAADFSNIINNLTQHLQASHDQLSTVLEERDLLNASHTETRKELHSLSTQNQDSMRRSAADFSNIINNLTQHLQASHDQLSTVLEERDLLNASLAETRKELHSLSTQKRTCPTGWTLFMSSCYHVSMKSGSWTTGREDCRTSGADLVVINSTEEQKFLSSLPETEAWIGLTDRDSEGTWMWIDGTALTLSSLTRRYWRAKEPNNGGGSWGDEDCAAMENYNKTEQNWNDASCESSRRWICEKSINC